jgi:hypothetical protein
MPFENDKKDLIEAATRSPRRCGPPSIDKIYLAKARLTRHSPHRPESARAGRPSR